MENDNNDFHIKKKFFIVKVLEYGSLKKIPYLLVSFLLFGILPLSIIFYLAYITNRLNVVFRLENWQTFFALSWLSFGPAIIKYVDESIIPKYFLNLKSILKMSESEFKEFYYQFENSFHDNYIYFSLILSLGVLFMGLVSKEYVEYYWNTHSILEPLSFFILSLLTFTLFLSGIGFCGIYYSIFFITQKIKSEGFILDPFSPDGNGGVKFFGEFYIKTTILFSTGSFVIPAGIQYMTFTNISVSYIGYVLLILFACFVALSFIIPIMSIKDIAAIEKDKLYMVMTGEYQKILPLYMNDDKKGSDIFRNVAKGINLLVIQQDINRLKEMKVWPVDMGIFTKLVSSIAFPLIVGYVQQYIDNLIISI